MNGLEWAVLSVACCIFGFGFYVIGQKLNKTNKSLKKIASFYDLFSDLSPKLVQFSRHLDEILEGGNKINQDSVEINRKMVEEYAKLRTAVEKMNLSLFPEPPVDGPRTLEVVQEDYETTYKDLVLQGMDPETAKYKAAEQELTQLYENGVSGINGFTL